MRNRDGGPAFPASHFDLSEIERGMTLRDYFAAKAMQGLLSNPELSEEIAKHGGAKSGWIERSAWAWADAMLEAREVQP